LYTEGRITDLYLIRFVHRVLLFTSIYRITGAVEVTAWARYNFLIEMLKV